MALTKWNVTATREQWAQVTVEASSAEEAERIARASDDLWKEVHWTTAKRREWHMGEVERTK